MWHHSPLQNISTLNITGYRVYICVTLLRTLAASLLILIPLWNLDCFAWMCIYSTDVILWATLYDLSAKLCMCVRTYVHVCVPTPKATNNYSHTAFYVKIVTPCFTILLFLLHHSCLLLNKLQTFLQRAYVNDYKCVVCSI